MKYIPLAFIALTLTACGTHNTTVTAMQWERRIPIEEFRTVRQEGWMWPPQDARNVQTERRFYGYDHIPCGSRIVTTGSGKSRTTRTETEWCNVPNYETWYSYDVDRWQEARITQRNGTKDDTREWPAEASDINDCATVALGCQRAGTRIEHLQAKLRYDDGSEASIDISEALWNDLAVNDKIKVDTNVFGTITALSKNTIAFR